MKYYTITIVLLVCFFLHKIEAQNRFRGGFVTGFNAAQMDGDAAAGFHKFGLNTGIRALIELGGRFELSTDILYSQRGSRTSKNESFIKRECTLNYLEVPVLFNIRDWQQNAGGENAYYKAAFSVGASYGRLFSAQSNSTFTHKAVVDKFSKNDVSLMAGIIFNPNRHWTFSCRIAKSVNKLFDFEKFPNDTIANGLPSLRGYYVSVQTGWIF